ncbi:adhesion regulating molecule [Auriculariales sp. MPI-PUGE-AT-0066]|nr:adhesion regulating molecule [Auriculariales sp. MPI-PUGE-AT-0066]
MAAQLLNVNQPGSVVVRAGRCFRRDNTSWVDPQPEKGVIIVQPTDEGLIQWQWASRTTNEVHEDLLIFPTDTNFEKVDQSREGHVFSLSFASSDQRHFYWFQDSTEARYSTYVSNINGLLQDPTFEPVNPASIPSASAPSSSAPAAAPAPGANNEAYQRLREILMSGGARGGGGGGGGAAGRAAPSVTLSDLLTPTNLAPIFAQPELARSVFPHLPTDMPFPPSEDVLRQVISSAQFRSAVAELDRALSTGLLGDLVRGLGLPESAGTGVEAFIRAVGEQARRQ